MKLIQATFLTILLSISLSPTKANEVIMFQSNDIPGLSFEYDPRIWRLELQEGANWGSLFSINPKIQSHNKVLHLSFSLEVPSGYVDCVDLFLPEDLIFVGKMVRVHQQDQIYRYLGRDKFIFRDESTINFQKLVDDWINYRYGDSAPSPINAQKVIAYGGCTEEPILVIGSVNTIERVIKKWNIINYPERFGYCVRLYINLENVAENVPLLVDADKVIASLKYDSTNSDGCKSLSPEK